MPRIVHINGEFLPLQAATLPLMDRGFLFGDAIYEVTAVIGGRLIDNDRHLARLERSLAEIGIPLPRPLPEIERIQRHLVDANGLEEGTVYMQVSRGVQERDFLPAAGLSPTFVVFTQQKQLLDTAAQREGIAVDLQPDLRWMRRDIKTTMLLGQVLAKQAAQRAGYTDVWLHEDGVITEGASASAFIIRGHTLVTRGNSRAILPGCTRAAVLKLIAEAGLVLEERGFTTAEAEAATEAFQTSATSLVTPVVRIGQSRIGDGRPGPLTRRLQTLYLAEVSAQPAQTN
ncbi:MULTISPECIES: D-amino-acid transaminase [unclassified Haematobacter]|uniref:D-amino-acid transaminase n=1 Tax=unclassified Haematobacter TaxID=2640585 RepID=UPI0025BF569D|nr:MULTISPECIES: D-amino-acid transaminase [unclassified Haematobacter]